MTAVRKNNQTVGNTGLYYVCFMLSRFGWNVMPTARNARGIDLVAYSEDAKTKLAIQVKALSKKTPVPLGGLLDNLFGDYLIICREVLSAKEPDCFILTPSEVRKLAHRGEKEGRVSYWLQPKDYDSANFRNCWTRIGVGNP